MQNSLGLEQTRHKVPSKERAGIVGEENENNREENLGEKICDRRERR